VSDELSLGEWGAGNITFTYNDTVRVYINATVIERFDEARFGLAYERNVTAVGGGLGMSILFGDNESLWHSDGDYLGCMADHPIQPNMTGFLLSVVVNVSSILDMIGVIGYVINFTLTNNNNTGMAVLVKNQTDDSDWFDRFVGNTMGIMGSPDLMIDAPLFGYFNFTKENFGNYEFITIPYMNITAGEHYYHEINFTTSYIESHPMMEGKSWSDVMVSEDGELEFLIHMLSRGTNDTEYWIDQFNSKFFIDLNVLYNYSIPHEQRYNSILANTTYRNGELFEPDAVYGVDGSERYGFSFNLSRVFTEGVYEANLTYEITLVMPIAFYRHTATTFPKPLGSGSAAVETINQMNNYVQFTYGHALIGQWIFTNITYAIAYQPPDSGLGKRYNSRTFTQNDTALAALYYIVPISLRLIKVQNVNTPKDWVFYEDIYVSRDTRQRSYVLQYTSVYNIPLRNPIVFDIYMRPTDITNSSLDTTRTTNIYGSDIYTMYRLNSLYAPNQFIPLTITYTTRASLTVTVVGKTWWGGTKILDDVKVSIYADGTPFEFSSAFTTSPVVFYETPFGSLEVKYISQTYDVSGSVKQYFMNRNNAQTLIIDSGYQEPWYFIFLEWWLWVLVGVIVFAIVFYYYRRPKGMGGKPKAFNP